MRARSIKQAFLLLAALVALLAPSFAGYQAQTVSALDCSFRYGFADLHAQVPQVVGDCLENEHHLAKTGDGLQETTRGLLVWRKEDNWTGFTDGYTTWALGPVGLQSRPNEGRYAWESDFGAPGTVALDAPARAEVASQPASDTQADLKQVPPAEQSGSGAVNQRLQQRAASQPADESPQPAATDTPASADVPAATDTPASADAADAVASVPDNATVQPAQVPAAPPADLSGTFSAAQVAGSAQVVAFSFQAQINRPGNFKVEASLDVGDNASISYTDGLVTSSEQGDFSAQRYDPAPVVNGRRSSLHWPLDVAFTPMAQWGRASATVYAQCLQPGPVSGSVTVTVVQDGYRAPLTFSETATADCSTAPLFIPTSQPTPTQRPSPTPTFTPTIAPTLTPSPTSTNNPAQASATEFVFATQTAEANPTSRAKSEKTATAVARETAGLPAVGVDVSTAINCAVSGRERLITVSIAVGEGGELADASIDLTITDPSGVAHPFSVTTTNGLATAQLPTHGQPGTYTVQVTKVRVTGSSNGNINTNVNVNLNDNNSNSANNLDLSASSTC